MSDATSSDPHSLADDPLEVVRLGRALASCLRSSESVPSGIIPAQGAADLGIQLYNLIHGTERTDPNRPNHHHLTQRWGHELLDSIQRIHAALFPIMAGSGGAPKWTEAGWILRQSSPVKTIPTTLLAPFERAVDELERVATVEKPPPTVRIRTEVLGHSFRCEELEVEPVGSAWYGEWITDGENTGRRMIARTSDGRWLGYSQGMEYRGGRYREPFDECTPTQALEWFSRYYEGDLPSTLEDDISAQLYVSTIGGLIGRLLSKSLEWMNEESGRRPGNISADALRCDLEPSEEPGFQRLTAFAKEQFGAEIITWEIAHKIVERVCRVRRIHPDEAERLTLNETADAVEGSTGLTCPGCGGPLDDCDEGRHCFACRTKPTVATEPRGNGESEPPANSLSDTSDYYIVDEERDRRWADLRKPDDGPPTFGRLAALVTHYVALIRLNADQNLVQRLGPEADHYLCCLPQSADSPVRWQWMDYNRRLMSMDGFKELDAYIRQPRHDRRWTPATVDWLRGELSRRWELIRRLHGSEKTIDELTLREVLTVLNAPEAGEHAPELAKDALEIRHQRIREMLAKNPEETSKRIAKAVGMSEPAVRNSPPWKAHQQGRRTKGQTQARPPKIKERQLTDKMLASRQGTDPDPSNISEFIDQYEPEFLDQATIDQRAKYHRMTPEEKLNEIYAWRHGISDS